MTCNSQHRFVGLFAASIALAFAAGCGSRNEQRPAVEPEAASPAVEAADGSKPAAERPGTKAAVTDGPTTEDTATEDTAAARPSAPDGGQLDAATLELARRLASEDPAVREAAAGQLDGQPAGGVVPMLEVLASGPEEARRGAAFYLLGRFNPNDAEQVARIRAALGDSDPAVRRLMLQAVARLPDAEQLESLPELTAVLVRSDESPATRAAAARMIGRLGPDAALALAALEKTLVEADDAQVRAACLFAIGQVASDAQAVAAFQQALSSDQATLRQQAASRLGRLETAAAPAAERLAETLSDPEPQVARAAADALVAIGEAAVEPLIKQLEAEDVNARRLAVFSLGRLGSTAAPAAAALRTRLEDPDEEVRGLAELVLQRLDQQR